MPMETRDAEAPALLPCSYAALPGDAEAAVVGRGRRTGPLAGGVSAAASRSGGGGICDTIMHKWNFLLE